MARNREVSEGVQEQGADESIRYTLSVSPAPSSIISVKVYELPAYTDVTATVMPSGTASYVGSVITLPLLTALTTDRAYRIEVRYSDGVNTIEPYMMVQCRR